MNLGLSSVLTGIQNALTGNKPGIVYDPKHPIFENVDSPVAPPEIIHHAAKHLDEIA